LSCRGFTAAQSLAGQARSDQLKAGLGPARSVHLSMIIVLFVVHVLIAIGLVGVILLQKSEGGALGMGGGGMSGFMTGRSTANLLTRVTAVLAAAFMTTSVLLVVVHNRERAPRSIIEQGAPTAPAAPVIPVAPTPQTPPAEPAQPSVPLAR
jgi:preprotein translocase subunit SecG